MKNDVTIFDIIVVVCVIILVPVIGWNSFVSTLADIEVQCPLMVDVQTDASYDSVWEGIAYLATSEEYAEFCDAWESAVDYGWSERCTD